MKVSKYGVFSGRYFPAFELNTERYPVFLRIQSECGKIQTRKNSIFGHFLRRYSRQTMYQKWRVLFMSLFTWKLMRDFKLKIIWCTLTQDQEVEKFPLIKLYTTVNTGELVSNRKSFWYCSCSMKNLLDKIY